MAYLFRFIRFCLNACSFIKHVTSPIRCVEKQEIAVKHRSNNQLELPL